MSEIDIPYRKSGDELEECLNEWDKAIDEWQIQAEEYAEVESTFKSWESAQKRAIMMASKASAVAAAAEIRGGGHWQVQYAETQKLGNAAEALRKKIRVCEARFEAQRSREASLRQVR